SFLFNDIARSYIYTLSLHDALPIFENVEILAKDSLFIFIETTVDINNLPSLDGTFLYTDHIEFDTSTKLQKVALVTLVQDAYFRSEEHTSELQSRENLVCRLLLEKK